MFVVFCQSVSDQNSECNTTAAHTITAYRKHVNSSEEIVHAGSFQVHPRTQYKCRAGVPIFCPLATEIYQKNDFFIKFRKKGSIQQKRYKRNRITTNRTDTQLVFTPLNSSEICFRGQHKKTGAPGGDRTLDPLLRRQLLYPLSYQGSTIRHIYYFIPESQKINPRRQKRIHFPPAQVVIFQKS